MTTRPVDPVDWELAERVAAQLASRTPPAVAWDTVEAELRFESDAMWASIIEQSGLPGLADAPTVRVIDRVEWIDHALHEFRDLVGAALVEHDVAGRSGRQLAVTRRLAGIELGLLLGWLSSRLLAQPDLLLGDLAGGELLVVGPNVAMTEHHHRFDPTQFRRWVLARSHAHHAQFASSDWLPAHYRRLLGEVFTIADPDPVSIFTGLRESARTRSESRQRLTEGGFVALLASDDQRRSLGALAGLIAMFEGHADLTAERAGAVGIPDALRIGRTLRERRRQTSPISRYVHRLNGLEARTSLPDSGSRFVLEVEQAAGRAALEACWTEPACLPTMEEIRDPARWLTRIHADPARR